MRRRTRLVTTDIPAEVMAEDGQYRPGWDDWCRDNGYRFVEFLMEAVRRDREWWAQRRST